MNYYHKKVSVIMTVYNKVDFLKKAIDSILKQTYQDIELVIIDDGSTDGSTDIIVDYAQQDSRITYRVRKNKGRVASLNEAIRMSSGEYIAIMDGDDYSYPERIKKQCEYLNSHHDVYIVGNKIDMEFDETLTEEERKEKLKILKNVNSEINYADILSSFNDSIKLCPGCFMFRRNLCEMIGYYHEYSCEDSEFLYRAICYGFKVFRLDEVLFTYCVHKVSRSCIKDQLKLDAIKYKMDYLESKIDFSSNNFIYMIWGYDFSGQSAAKYLSEKVSNGKLIAYIDSFSENMELEIPIIKPDKIVKMEPDYIFICTNGGGEYARNYLNDLGYMQYIDYFKIV